LNIANGPDGTVPSIPALLVGGYGSLLALERFFGDGRGRIFDWCGHGDARLGVEGLGVGVEEHSTCGYDWVLLLLSLDL
jgi:hypothetical protein